MLLSSSVPFMLQSETTPLIFILGCSDGTRLCRNRRCRLELGSHTYRILGNRGDRGRAVSCRYMLDVLPKGVRNSSFNAPFGTNLCNPSHSIQWGRKYGIRIYLDLHALPGSQNGWVSQPYLRSKYLEEL